MWAGLRALAEPSSQEVLAERRALVVRVQRVRPESEQPRASARRAAVERRAMVECRAAGRCPVARPALPEAVERREVAKAVRCREAERRGLSPAPAESGLVARPAVARAERPEAAARQAPQAVHRWFRGMVVPITARTGGVS